MSPSCDAQRSLTEKRFKTKRKKKGREEKEGEEKKERKEKRKKKSYLLIPDNISIIPLKLFISFRDSMMRMNLNKK